jgi:hypothetical protein
VLGSDIGIPAGSVLLEGGTTLRVVNAVGVVMDAGVIALAVLLTHPRGRRVPGWLLAGPVWVATGLLAPIVLAFPVQVLLGAVNGSASGEREAAEPFLAGWVFTVVYTGFIAQGLTLGALFVLYARRRWGHLWSGRIGDLRTGRLPQVGSIAIVVLLAAVPLGMHGWWAFGGSVGLAPARAAERTRDFAVLEGTFVALALMTAVSVLVWVRSWGRRLPVWLPAATAVVGSAGLAGWGGWLLVVAAMNTDASQQTTLAATLTYLTQILLGVAVLVMTQRVVRP